MYGTSFVSFISGVCLMRMGFTMLTNKRLNRYPNLLVAWLSIFESFIFLNYSGQVLLKDQIFQYFEAIWNALFAPTIDYFHPGDFNGKSVWDNAFRARYFMKAYGVFMVQLIYSCLLLEILRTTRNPFKPEKEYWCHYKFFIVCFCLILTGIILRLVISAYHIDGILPFELFAGMFIVPLLLNTLILCRLFAKRTHNQLRKMLRNIVMM